MKYDHNLEILNTPFFAEKITGLFLDQSPEMIKKINNDNKKVNLNKLFSFEKINEFGEGNNFLEQFKINLEHEEGKSIYVNIGKSPFEQGEKNEITEHTPQNFMVTNKDDSLLYEIDFFCGKNAEIISSNNFSEKRIDYDRVLNPQYYQEYRGEHDIYQDQHEYDHEEENRVLNINPDQEKISDYQYDLISVIQKINNNYLKENEKIEFNLPTRSYEQGSMYNSENYSTLIDNLSLDYLEPSQLAECYDGINKETYSFLWNNLVKLNLHIEKYAKELNIEKPIELNVKSLWFLIPEKNQENIVNVLSVSKDIKLKNGVKMTEIIPLDVWSDKDESKKLYMVSVKNNKDSNKIFKSKEESEEYYKKESSFKLNERIPF